MLEIDQNKQRAAAELLAGLLGGMKHWPLVKQDKIWEWIKPFLGKILGSNVKSDTLFVWSSFLEVRFSSKNVRRRHSLIRNLVYVLQQGSSTSTATRRLYLREF